VSSAQRVLVIVPTYNERDNVERIAERLLAAVPAANLLIVDDGSPDGTGKIADEMAEVDQRITVMHRTGKSGLGTAYIAGFSYGLSNGYDVMVEMDADGSHAPEQLPRLLSALEHADLVIGSRWVPGGKLVDWPRSREALSRGANLYTRLALGIDIRDATGGFRAYRRAVLETIDYQTVSSEGYCFQIDLAWRTVRAVFRVAEVPITFAERERGVSKMDGSIVREAFVRVAEWGVTHRAAQLRGLVNRDR
jgi:dolichol-phosphate mannosyltransferase